MIYTKKESLEDRIVRLLSSRNQTITSLVSELSNEGNKSTIQGIYKALRFLRTEEVVIKTNEIFSLSEEWRNKTVSELSKTDNRFELSEGESIRLDLASLVHLDQQWKNIVLPFHEVYPNHPVFFYNPHDIWIHLSETRKQSEIAYYKTFEDTKTYGFIMNGGSTPFDKLIKTERSNNYVQITTGDSGFKNTDYLTIFSDYIITVRVSPRLAQEIESCYQNADSVIQLESLLHKIGIEKKKVKLFIEKNKMKAKKLRKKMSADFHVPREVREKFDLF
jgi:hypothetical protein